MGTPLLARRAPCVTRRPPATQRAAQLPVTAVTCTTAPGTTAWPGPRNHNTFIHTNNTRSHTQLPVTAGKWYARDSAGDNGAALALGRGFPGGCGGVAKVGQGFCQKL